MNKKSLSIFALSFVALSCSAQTNAASFPLNFDDGYTILHSNAKVDILFHNDGSAPITSLAYTVEDISSGSISSEKTLTFTDAVPAGENGTATFKVPAGSSVGVCQKNVTITKVNGVANETAAIKASASGNICTLSEKMPKRTIEEEYTGTWCGWCPRGTVGIEQLSEKYPDTFVGAAFHYDDEFWFSEVGYHDGFPQCELNRHANVDPYNGSTGSEPLGIEKDYLKEQNILPFASLDMQAVWADNSKQKIMVKSNMKFVYNTSDEFALLYILTENGLSGSRQASYYSGKEEYAGDPYMAFWYNGGSTNVYNHVVVAFAGRENGIDGSVSSPVSVGMEQSYDYCFDISGNSRIKDKSKLHMIVCLLDKTKGTIINTDFGEISSEETGIRSVSSSPSSATYYSLDGRRLSSPSNTISIVRHPDGTSVLQTR